MIDAATTPDDKTGPTSGGSGALVRHMGLFSLVVYGVGDMVGAGIYGTVGEAAGALGNACWVAFAVSMVAAMLTGVSYASLASRYPKAGGAAYITHRAYRFPFLSYMVGLTVAASGLTSMAAGSNVFSDNLMKFVAVPKWALIVAFLAVLAAINFRGIKESIWTNLLCTGMEVGGLVFVIIVGARFWGSVDYTETASGVPLTSAEGMKLILNGTALTFFAFVGFEDMLNVSEEVNDPVRTMPRGLILSLIVVTALYITISVTAVSVVDSRQLSDAKTYGAPLAQVTNKAAPWLSPWVFTAITLFAVANTALINYIMGSRLLYGMARQGLVPAALGRVHSRRRTPHVAIGVLFVIVLALGLAGGVKQLASATALLLLACFVLVNGALVVLKRRPAEPRGAFEIPVVVPILGMLVCAGLIIGRLLTRNAQGQYEWQAPAIALGLAAGIALLYAVLRPRNIDERTLSAAEGAGASEARPS
ncbi:MAG TPA: APC family permease [Tepidisphaeraceae bacterium]|nr:APC family permease [Tepidisphaeraceae bacterium]